RLHRTRGRLRESVARENRTPRLSGGRWLASGQLGAPPPTWRKTVWNVLERHFPSFCLTVPHAEHSRTEDRPERQRVDQRSGWPTACCDPVSCPHDQYRSWGI